MGKIANRAILESNKMKIRKVIRDIGIQKQILFSMLLLAVLAIGVLGYISYKTSADAIEQNYVQSYDSALKNTSKVLDLNLNSIIETVRGYLSDDELCDLLAESTYEKGKFSSRHKLVLDEVVDSLLTQQVSVNGIAVMDLHGHCYMQRTTNKGTYDFYNWYDEHNYLEESWTEVARNAKGKEVFFGYNVLEGEDEEALSMVKYLINASNNEPMGYIVVPLSKNLLRKSIVVSGISYQSGSYLVVDENKNNYALYFNGDQAEEKNVIRHYLSGEESDKYVFSSVKNETTGWRIINVVEKNELSNDIVDIGFAIVACGLALIILSSILARTISETITHPLKQLESVIEQVGEGERHIIETFDDGEVGRIGQKFKEMVNTNLELSEHLMSVKLNEREAELLLLQSQINPHYLYNTLDSLYFVAIMHEDDQLAEMIMALSNNFRLALNNGEKYIRVKDSILWIQEYMKLQNMRYNNRFELVIDVQEEMMEKKTLMFILQPFIENAMYHGLEPKIGNGKIAVTGRIENENMIFTIEDDGVGVADVSVLEKGYGIRNVKERIRLNYGEKYGITAESTYKVGTKITIVVPVE